MSQDRAYVFLFIPGVLGLIGWLLYHLYRGVLTELRSLEARRRASLSFSLFAVTQIWQRINLFGAQPVNITKTFRVDEKFEFDVTASVDAFKNTESGAIGATFAWTADSATFGTLSLLDDSTYKIGFAPNGALGTTVITGVPTVSGENTDGFQPQNIVLTLTTTIGKPVDFTGTVTITDSGVDAAATTPAPTPAPAPTDAGSTPVASTPTDSSAPSPTPVDGGVPAPVADTPSTVPTGGAADGVVQAPVGDTPADGTTAPDSGTTASVAPVESAQPVSTPTGPINAAPDTTSTQ